MSDQGPSMLVNGRVVTALTPERIARIAELIRDEVTLEDWPAEFFAVADNVRRRDALLNSVIAPGEALRRAVALGPETLACRDKAGASARARRRGFPHRAEMGLLPRGRAAGRRNARRRLQCG